MTGSRAGFALVTVLWLVVAVSTMLAIGLQQVRLAGLATENRIGQTRALWAARGCVSLLQARHERGESVGSEAVPMGPATLCHIESMDWDERVNPNLVDSVGLTRVMGDSVKVASLLDWIDEDDVARSAGAESTWYAERHRRLPRHAAVMAVAELSLVRGFEGSDLLSLEELFTVWGDGGVSPNRASGLVLSSVAALAPGDVERLLSVRAAGRRFENAEEVTLRLDMDPTADEFRELARRLSFRRPARTVRVTGLTDLGTRSVSTRLDVELVPVGDRLAVSVLEGL